MKIIKEEWKTIVSTAHKNGSLKRQVCTPKTDKMEVVDKNGVHAVWEYDKVHQTIMLSRV